ncbi:hypothetical protein NC651_021851 [Populus alba x Populus x berolinensis]|nr:hypothetical protein NC651_021851 [Populus alba x Populus x berolinensis]
MKQSLCEGTVGVTSINGLVESFALSQNKRRQVVERSGVHFEVFRTSLHGMLKKKKKKKKSSHGHRVFQTPFPIMEMLAPKNKRIMKRNIGRDAIKGGVKRKQGVLGRMHNASFPNLLDALNVRWGNLVGSSDDPARPHGGNHTAGQWRVVDHGTEDGRVAKHRDHTGQSPLDNADGHMDDGAEEPIDGVEVGVTFEVPLEMHMLSFHKDHDFYIKHVPGKSTVPLILDVAS